MSADIGGTHFDDQSSELNAAKLNKLNPHGFVYQASGDGLLEVSVRPANWLLNAGTEQLYAGSSGNSIPASSTRYIYLDDSNALQIASSIPALSNEYFLCAKVVTNGSQVTEIHNFNQPFASYRT